MCENRTEASHTDLNLFQIGRTTAARVNFSEQVLGTLAHTPAQAAGLSPSPGLWWQLVHNPATTSPRTASLLPTSSQSALSCLSLLEKKNKPQGRPRLNSPGPNACDYRGTHSLELGLAAQGCVNEQMQSQSTTGAQSTPSPIFHQPMWLTNRHNSYRPVP